MANAFVHILKILYICLKSFVFLLLPSKYFTKKKKVEGDVVLVTGAGSGIGRLIALNFASLGAKLVLWDVDQKGNEETRDLIKSKGGQAWSYVCDVSNREAVYATANQVKTEAGQVSILVNNAGVVIGKNFLDLPDDKVEKVFGVNALAHFWTCKAFLPDMIKKNKGHIVTIASVAGLVSLDKLSDYCASKHAAVGLDNSLKIELRLAGYTGVRTTLVCPYQVGTGLFEGFKPAVLSTLTPEYVAEETVNATLTNQEVLILPKVLNFVIPLVFILPVECIFEMYELFGGSNMMSNFKGKCPALDTMKKVK